MSRKRVPVMTFHDVPHSDDESQPVPPPLNHAVTECAIDDQGGVATSNYRVSLHESHSSSPPPDWSTHLFMDGQPERSYDVNDEGEPIFPDYIHFLDGLVPEALKKRRKHQSDDPLKMWKQDIGVFLDEFIRLDGRGDFADQADCNLCKAKPPQYRCRDCISDELFCKMCVVDLHALNPLHRIEFWNDDLFFEPITLKALGARIQLGHIVGDPCPNPRQAKGDAFVIIDTHGIHDVGLDFCGCESSKGVVRQLLRSRLYPATVQNPATAATFRVLERFHLLSFESKCSAYEFYHSLVHESDNIGIQPPKDRYDELLRMVREWRHLKVLKRSGRGHDPSGLDGTDEGACAVLCPACPQPGKNLVPGWENASEGERWIYTLFLALDANFRMTRKHVSSELKDPALSRGFSYFVDETAFKDHLKTYADEKQAPSTCVSHDAVNSADTKDKCGMSVTGIGTVDCARHGIRRANAVGDLQKGERYINMDYLFYSSLRDTSLPRIVVSYDIACQWDRNFWARMSQKFPGGWAVNRGCVYLVFLVPKFHLPAHIKRCNIDYSFNYTKWVGRTDGEEVERGWARLNGLSYSTKEMGPGSRRDTIEDHMGYSNWRKVTGLGVSLLDKIKNAVPEHIDHAASHRQFETVLKAQDILQWTNEVEEWEADNNKPNPFETREKVLTQAGVRLALALQESLELGSSVTPTIRSAISPSAMITMGLELEELQRRLRRDSAALGQHATNLQRAKLQERANGLRKRISSWFDIQALYIPGTTLLRSGAADYIPPNAPDIKVFDIEIWLPSAIGRRVACDTTLRDFEWQLRVAQANDALHLLRQNLRLDSFLMKKKKDWDRGVKQNTRSQTVIKQNMAKVNEGALKYRVARAALVKLAPLLGKSHGWAQALQPLADEDVRGLPVQGLGEGKRTMSWIWTSPGVGSNKGPELPGLNDTLRIQWCRSRARAMRWDEEVKLLTEEMRRVRAFLAWHSDWWSQQEARRECGDSFQEEGLKAYARRQSHIRRSLRLYFEWLWRHVETWVALGEVPNDEGPDASALESDEDLDGLPSL